MKRKFDAAIQLNNYLKKGALTLVASMLIVIPNLPVYSSIGSYQTASKAIVANTYYDHLGEIEKPSALIGGLGSGAIGTLAVISAVGVVIALSVFAHPNKSMNCDHLDIYYFKSDFSQFDN